MNPNQGENMSKPESKEKAQFQRKRRETPSAQELKVPGYGEPRRMTEETGQQLRARLIASGQIKENPKYDGYMTSEEVKAYREKLIAQGLLKPDNGRGKYRPRPKMFRTNRPGRA
jgi:hypothetical protein